MNSNDLFSFLEDDNENNNEETMQVEETATMEKILQKRKANTPSPIIPDVKAEADADASTTGAGPSAPKKARMSSPKPVILDDFETEAKREVAADAGLTGAADGGSRLELKHQVRTLSRPPRMS